MLPSSPLAWTHLLIATFLAVLFLQSGIDKVVDWKGNLSWLTGHFEQSPLAGFVPAMLATVTVVELGAGAMNAVAVPALLLGSGGLGVRLAVLGCALSAVALLMLFFGQRVAKDYAGAAVLVNYFVLTVLGLYFLGLGPA